MCGHLCHLSTYHTSLPGFNYYLSPPIPELTKMFAKQKRCLKQYYTVLYVFLLSILPHSFESVCCCYCLQGDKCPSVVMAIPDFVKTNEMFETLKKDMNSQQRVAISKAFFLPFQEGMWAKNSVFIAHGRKRFIVHRKPYSCFLVK